MNEITDIPTVPAKSQPKRTPSSKQARAFGQGIINLTLMILTIRDIRRRSDEEINGKRKFWMMAAFAPPIGPIAYFIFGRKRNVQQEIPLSPVDSAPQTDVTSI